MLPGAGALVGPILLILSTISAFLGCPLRLDGPAGVLIGAQDDAALLPVTGAADRGREVSRGLFAREEPLRLFFRYRCPVNFEGDPQRAPFSPSRAAPGLFSGDHVSRIGLGLGDTDLTVDAFPESRGRTARWDGRGVVIILFFEVEGDLPLLFIED